MIKLLPYLRLAVDQQASDLYFTAEAPVMLRIEGEMSAVGHEPLSAEALEDLVFGILTPAQRQEFDTCHELDLATAAGGLGRFRVNIYRQRGCTSMVMRRIPADVPELDALGLPSVLKELALLNRGLILLGGPTGCGKSTTLASMIRHRNEARAGHILSIEDPIEYVHENRRAIISQREVGIDTQSYERALISAMREAPDVIYIGEIRRRETMEACIQLSNSGHLVLSTVHANNATQTLQRILNFYPVDQRDQLYTDLSMTMRAVISQRLVPGVTGRRVAAVETLINTPYIAELILTRHIEEIPVSMEQDRDRGMCTFDQALLELHESEKITLEAALEYADSRAELRARIGFGA